MNPEPSSREQIEARVTALLLGELPEGEAQLLRWTISQDAALKKLHDELQATIALVREAEKNLAEPTAETPTSLKFSNERREKLLAHFKTPCPETKPAKELFWLKRIQAPSLSPVMVALSVVLVLGLLAALSIPNFVRSRSTSKANTVVNNMRQIDAAKNQWALEHHVSLDAVPTRDDLKPYFAEGKLPASVVGEAYVIGKVSEPVTANVETKVAENKLGISTIKLPADGVLVLNEQLQPVDKRSLLMAKAQAGANGVRRANDVMTVAPQPVLAPPPAQIVLPKTEPPSSDALVNDGKLLYEMGKLDDASAKFKEALKDNPNNRAAGYYQNLTEQTRFARESASHSADTQTRLASIEKPWVQSTPSIGPLPANDSAPSSPVAGPEPQAGSFSENFVASAGGGGGGGVYVIKPGDTLSKIARENGTTVKALEEVNNLSSSKILAGAKMKLPTETGILGSSSPVPSDQKFSAGAGIASADVAGDAGVQNRFYRSRSDQNANDRNNALALGDVPNADMTLGQRQLGLNYQAGTSTIRLPAVLPPPASSAPSKLVLIPPEGAFALDSGKFYSSLTRSSSGELRYMITNSSDIVLNNLNNGPSANGTINGMSGDNIILDQSANATFAPSLNADQLQQIHSQVIDGERDYKEQVSQLQQLKQLDKTKLRDVLPTVISDSKLSKLLGELHESEQKLAVLNTDYSSGTPNATRAETQIAKLNKQIDDRVAGILSSMEQQAKSKKAALTVLNQTVEEAKAKNIAEAARYQPYYDAKRNLAELEDHHKLLASKIVAEKLNAATPKSSMVQIVDAAEPTGNRSFWQSLTDEYESSARIKIENDVSNISAGGTISYDPYFIQTTFEIMQSELVLGKVVDSLKLQDTWAKDNGGKKLTRAEAVAQLKSQLEFKPVKNTRLIQIGATSDSPDEAAKIANAVVRAYVDYRAETRQQMGAKGMEVLEQQYLQESNQIQQIQREVDKLAPKAENHGDQPLPRHALNAPIPQPEFLTRENAFSTFSLNVSDVSFKLAEASLAKGLLPEAASIRSEEFINAFDYRDPEAAPGQPLAFASERARDPFAHNRDLLRFSIKTAAAGRQAGRALNLVLLLDDSGSMERADRVAIIREALRVLATQLHAQDKISVVTFSRTARLWADGVPGNQAGDTLKRVGGITPEGGTNLEEAMRLAYETARRHYLANGMNRVVLLTDGAANLGEVDPTVLTQMVEANRKQGIALDCFGIGWEDYNDDLLEQLSSNGDGRYAFLDSPADAAGEFAAKLAGALQVAAQDVKVQVEFNPQRVVAWRQIGYAKHQLTKEQFRDNTVDAGEIAAQEAGNALYTIQVKPDGNGPIATVRVRYRVPGTQDYRERSWAVPYNGTASTLEQSTAAMRLAGVAGEFAEWLAESPFAQEVSLNDLQNLMTGVPEVYGADQRPKQLAVMIREAKSLSGK